MKIVENNKQKFERKLMIRRRKEMPYLSKF